MEKKLKVGIIGCGGVSKNHINSHIGLPWRRDPSDGQFKFLLKSKDPYNEVAAICDLDKQKATDTYEHYKSNGYEIKNVFYGIDSYKDILKLDLDAVSICVPPINDKIDIIRDCLKKDNLHLLVEKPLSFDFSSAKIIYDEFKKIRTENRVFAMCYNWRNTYLMNKLRELILNKKYGRLCFMEVIHNQAYNYSNPGSFYYDMGSMVDKNVHDINFMRYLNGEIKNIQRVISYGNIPQSPDSISINFEYENGVKARYYNMNGAGEGNNSLTVRCVFEKGTVIGFGSNINPEFEWKDADYYRIIGPEGEIFEQDRFNSNRPEKFSIIDVGEQGGGALFHKNIIEDFVKAVKTGSLSKSSIEDGYRDLQVIEAVKKANNNNISVDVFFDI